MKKRKANRNRNTDPVTVRGVQFRNADAVAAHFNVTRDHVLYALRSGRLDLIRRSQAIYRRRRP